MSNLYDAQRALALLIAANATPVIVGKLARVCWSMPMDFGYVLRDRRRLFGDHKTWRGFISGIVACTLVAMALDLPWELGVGFAALSLLGDAFSSAIKRRLNLLPGKEVLGLDQLGEALLPLILFAGELSLNATDVLVATVAFVLLDVLVVPLRHL